MISLQNIHKTFDGKDVLKGIDLEVGKGESFVVIGGSGSGKSVLIKCILGLLKPDRGQISIDGKAKFDMSQFGMLFQGAALFDSMPTWKNVAFRHLQNGMSPTKAKDIALTKLARVGLAAETADMFPAELSGGMQKRAGLARAIAADPSVIFFDEPTTGLDPIMSGVINALIHEIVTEMGATAITITHDMRTVDAIADRVGFLRDGKLQWVGPPSALSNSDNIHLRNFITG